MYYILRNTSAGVALSSDWEHVLLSKTVVHNPCAVVGSSHSFWSPAAHAPEELLAAVPGTNAHDFRQQPWQRSHTKNLTNILSFPAPFGGLPEQLAVLLRSYPKHLTYPEPVLRLFDGYQKREEPFFLHSAADPGIPFSSEPEAALGTVLWLDWKTKGCLWCWKKSAAFWKAHADNGGMWKMSECWDVPSQ